jgi:hypothetical protein
MINHLTGIEIAESTDPELFFVVRAEDYKTLKQAINQKRKRKEKECEPDLATLFGMSPSIALTKEMAKHRFEVLIQNHNTK